MDLLTSYTTRQPGLRGGGTERIATCPVLSRAEFDRLAAANPTGPDYTVGTAAGYPSSGYWVVASSVHHGYDALLVHLGHGGVCPVAYCAAIHPDSHHCSGLDEWGEMMTVDSSGYYHLSADGWLAAPGGGEMTPEIAESMAAMSRAQMAIADEAIARWWGDQ